MKLVDFEKEFNKLDIDFERIAERSDELIEYNGFLPLFVRCLIMHEWMDYLSEQGTYDKVLQECGDTKPHTYDEAVKELKDWVKENKEYSDFIY